MAVRGGFVNIRMLMGGGDIVLYLLIDSDDYIEVGYTADGL